MRARLVALALLALGLPWPAGARADDEVQATPVPIEDATGHALERATAVLARLEQREGDARMRIAVFGDSHIACDLFTGALRRRLQTRFGDGGHGFVVLGAGWPHYRPLDILQGASRAFLTRRLRPRERGVFRLGLGSAVSTALSPGAVSWVATNTDGPLGREVSRFEVLYERAPGGGTMAVRLDGRPVATLAASAPAREAASRVILAPTGPHRLEIEALGPGPLSVYGAILERDGRGVVVDSLGVPSVTSTSLEHSDLELLDQQLRARAPDLLVWAFGTNDVRDRDLDLTRYRARIAKLLTRIQRGGRASSCLVLGPIDRRRRTVDGAWRASLDEIIELQRGAARDAGCAFWDQRAAMGGAGSMLRWMVPRPRLTLRDGVHLSARGYDRLAEALVAALLSHPRR